MSNIELTLSELSSFQDLPYQLLSIHIITPDRLIEPTDLQDLQLPVAIDSTIGVIISGRAPIWLYGFLIHELHPTPWVAVYDPRLGGGVVVSTHSRLAKVGQLIPLRVSLISNLCPAIMIIGPPDSGKSVLSYALFKSLLPINPEIYLQRANWDGEGNYILELGASTSEDLGENFKQINKGRLSERFFPYHAKAILELRRQKKLVIVDVGGMIQPEKMPILEACTHYIVISSQPDAIESWHQFCRDRGHLIPLAAIYSVLDSVENVEQEEPFLVMTSGAWVRGKAKVIPEILLQKIIRLCSLSTEGNLK